MDEVEILKEVEQANLDLYESFFIDRGTQETRLKTNVGNAHSLLYNYTTFRVNVYILHICLYFHNPLMIL